MKAGELRVYYADELNPALDTAIEKAVKSFGYRRWGSGVNFNNGVRDLVFEKRDSKKGE